jgi:hypothetical protein
VKYKGLPTALGRSPGDEFEHILTRIKKLVKGWIPKTLSSVAREHSSKQYAKLFLHIPRVALDFQRTFARKSKVVFQGFGGEETTIRGKSMGRNGRILRYPRPREVWGSDTFNY